MKSIGLISDTHGLLREEAVQALGGVDLIIHAGDIGSEEVIRELRKIAPVIAVRGNCDRVNGLKHIRKQNALRLKIRIFKHQ